MNNGITGIVSHLDSCKKNVRGMLGDEKLCYGSHGGKV